MSSWVALLLGEFLLLVLVVMLVPLWIAGNRRLVIRSIAALVLTWATIKMIKISVPLPRPFEVLGVEPGTWVAASESFPSSHAGVAFALATSVWLDRPRRRLGLVMLLVAIAVAIGRVLLWVHFPIDVIVGAVIGGVFGFVLDAVIADSGAKKTE